MRDMSAWERFRYEILRRTFSSSYRSLFYSSLRFLLENNTPLLVAIQEIEDVHTNFGEHWHPLAELTADCIEALRDNSEGNSLEDVLAKWGPLEEAALISSGMASGSLPDVLKQVNVLIEARRTIFMMVLQMLIYPLLLIVLVGGAFAVVTYAVKPQLEQMSDPATWSGALSVLAMMSDTIEHSGGIAGLAFGMFVFWVLWSLPRWANPLRQWADYLAPWSIYKELQGAIFLMNISSLLDANVKTLDALNQLRRFASPWLRVRIEAAIDNLEEGASLGKALRDSGYHFPSKEGVNYLYLLTSRDGSAAMIRNYGDEFLKTMLSRIQFRITRMRFYSFMLIISFFVLLLLSGFQLQDMGNSTRF
ncbi:type II secretion system F family protein [Pectobacterium brasiliense]|uniref:Type II secretion system F family protein n=1 Tax=Pectobacterium brasiliense TaxID=180957 RepID=A0A3S0ZTE2_9GAMM|nr:MULTISPECIES: type II secretion system F family protein [Pectobacterium]GKW29493.1 pilus biosynthesis protein PilR [Pectobacterium carotovorum subsp. carotovorum]MBN3048123.1 type II secretion system F family protein [Pectobacterium brasiliense]MBN3057097.1 type II secretion system F family protein [Pectobacterium brasiliense]MBN3077590.1 type II secretion system F family protein [Pectobacterium brasiliense]MBN3082054.1 type II secretion system F family protein [Pectobacterium polaris]